MPSKNPVNFGEEGSRRKMLLIFYFVNFYSRQQFSLNRRILKYNKNKAWIKGLVLFKSIDLNKVFFLVNDLHTVKPTQLSGAFGAFFGVTSIWIKIPVLCCVCARTLGGDFFFFVSCSKKIAEETSVSWGCCLVPDGGVFLGRVT